MAPAQMPALAKEFLMDQDITVVNTFVQVSEKPRGTPHERRLLRSQTVPATAADAQEAEEQFEGEGCEGCEGDLVAQQRSEKSVIEDCFGSAASTPRFWHSATPDRWEWDAMLQEEGTTGPPHDGIIRQSSEKSVIEDCHEPEPWQPSETMRKLQSLRTQTRFDTPDVWELQAICKSFGESPAEPALPSATSVTSVAGLVHSSTPDPWEWDAMLQEEGQDRIDKPGCVTQPCMALPNVGRPAPETSLVPMQSCEYPRLLGSLSPKSMRPGTLETRRLQEHTSTLVKWCVDALKFTSNSGRLVSPDFQLHFPFPGEAEPLALSFRMMVIGGKNAGFKKAKGRGSLELKCSSAVPPGLQSITAFVAVCAGESQLIGAKPIKHSFVEKTCCQLRNGEEASWDFKKLIGDATICEIAVEIHL